MKKHYIGATYDLTQENMNGLIEQLENEQMRADKLTGAVDELIEALEKADKYWFDGFDPKNNSTACPACMFCDMGEAGAKRNQDGHDVECHVSWAHDTLAEVKAKLGRLK
jgi:hypothetical protein